MLFWITTAALVALVALLLGLALMRGRAEGEPAAAYDLRVYRDQLRDVERDLARGVLTNSEAERLKLEISRRVLEADRAVAAAVAAPRAPRGGTIVAALGGAALLASAFMLYERIGAPGFADQPMAGRLALANELYDNRPSQDEAEKTALAERGDLPAPDPRFAELMERLRKAVAARPNDVQGLELLARNEAGIGNYHDAWQAQGRVIALKGAAATDADYATLAELMIVATNGFVTADAETALAQAMEKNPANGTARYYIGLMMAQNGRADRAFRIWAPLLEEGPEDAPWIAPIRDNIESLAWLAGESDYTPPAPIGGGPSAADMAAAADMSPEDRQAMIRSMVDGLNDRLAKEGGTAADWAKLIGALGVLGETDRASAIWTEAQGIFAARPEDLATVKAAADSAGLTGDAPPPPAAAPALKGPTAEQMQSAAEMSPEERQQMIRGMVDGLNDRLTAEGGTAAEWAQLIGALANLGDSTAAADALTRAEAAFDGRPDDLAQIRTAARAAGVAP